jgi:hypothetical protein
MLLNKVSWHYKQCLGGILLVWNPWNVNKTQLAGQELWAFEWSHCCKWEVWFRVWPLTSLLISHSSLLDKSCMMSWELIIMWRNLHTPLILAFPTRLTTTVCGPVCYIYIYIYIYIYFFFFFFFKWNLAYSLKLLGLPPSTILRCNFNSVAIHKRHVYTVLEIYWTFSLFSFFRCLQNEHGYFVFLNRYSKRLHLCNGYNIKKNLKNPPILGFELNSSPQSMFSGLLEHSVCYQTLTSYILLNIVEACTIVDTRQQKKIDLYVSF